MRKPWEASTSEAAEAGVAKSTTEEEVTGCTVAEEED